MSRVLNQLYRELLLTVSYSAQFGYPLTVGELVLRKITRASSLSQSLPKELQTQIQAADLPTVNLTSSTQVLFQRSLWLRMLVQFINLGHVEYLGGYIFLRGRQHTVATRTRRKKTTAAKFAELEPLISILRKLPGIAGVAVTGSAAVFNADTDDDVDIMIITEAHRLWLLRPLIVFIAFIYGKRRTWYREEKNSWCFNLWLERSSLAQPAAAHSLYVAYEVCQAKWLIDVSGCKQSFLRQNSWVQRYIPAYYSWCKNQPVVYPVAQDAQSLPYWPILAELLSLCNYAAYVVQRGYMARHMTRERVSLHTAFFHPRDTGMLVAARHHAVVSELSA